MFMANNLKDFLASSRSTLIYAKENFSRVLLALSDFEACVIVRGYLAWTCRKVPFLAQSKRWVTIVLESATLWSVTQKLASLISR